MIEPTPDPLRYERNKALERYVIMKAAVYNSKVNYAFAYLETERTINSKDLAIFENHLRNRLAEYLRSYPYTLYNPNFYIRPSTNSDKIRLEYFVNFINPRLQNPRIQ